MVDSADEPPLSGHLHPWAKTATSSTLDPSSSTDSNPSQSGHHAGHNSTGLPAGLTSTHGITNVEDTKQKTTPVVDKKGDGTESTALGQSDTKVPKDPVFDRFIRDVKLIARSSWINWLLLTVPVGIILGALVDWGHIDVVDPSIVFAVNAVAIVPLASLLAFATESVASKMGDTVGALMNVTFGNAVELIIFIIALVDGQVRVVQAAAVGSILSNLLIILGMSFLLGGLRFREQVYNSTVSQMSACLLCLSVISLLLPTAFHASFNDPENGNRMVLQVSRGTSIVLLLVYGLYLVFSLKSHSFMYASTPQHIIDEEAAHPGVLTTMLNSSSSSDTSSSSDSDSDSSRSSRNTAMRIKRAFRRKRRQSSRSSKDAPSTINAAPVRNATNENISSMRSVRRAGSVIDEPVFSGDEADVDANPRGGRRRSARHPITRDFESSNVDGEDEKSTNRSRRRHKRSKRTKRGRQNSNEDTINEKAEGQIHAQAVPQPTPVPQLQLPGTDSPKPSTDASKRPFNLRNISSHVTPAFNAHAVFPHHQAVARPLAMPNAMRPLSASRSPSRRRLTRSSSMPDMLHPTMSNDRAVLSTPRPAGQRPPSQALHDVVEEEPNEVKRHLSGTSSIILLLITTGFVAICAEFLVGSIDHLISSTGISQAFLGLIILPLVGNAAEHVTAVTVAYKNKMDLAIGIALGSSIQVAILITPFMVVLGWIIKQDMSLYFSLFETVSLFASAMIVGFLLIDGRSNYLEGALLIAAYVIIALAAFFYPNCGLSTVSGLTDGTAENCAAA